MAVVGVDYHSAGGSYGPRVTAGNLQELMMFDEFLWKFSEDDRCTDDDFTFSFLLQFFRKDLQKCWHHDTCVNLKKMIGCHGVTYPHTARLESLAKEAMTSQKQDPSYLEVVAVSGGLWIRVGCVCCYVVGSPFMVE